MVEDLPVPEGVEVEPMLDIMSQRPSAQSSLVRTGP